jgi:hypothetical protein
MSNGTQERRIAVVTLILLIMVTIEVRESAKAVTPGNPPRSGNRGM